MRKINKILLLTAISLTLGSCAAVKLTPGGEKVRVLEPNEVSSCKKLGKTNTSVTHIVLGIKRPMETIERELAIIARNSANNMGGDTIVPLTIAEDGKQSFVIYKCVDPES